MPTLLPIVLAPDARLRLRCREVTSDEFGPALDAKMDDMVATMQAADGAGLAGPQVGDMRRVIIVNLGPRNATVPTKMVNPVIKKATQIRSTDEEGCLSIPGKKVNVSRARQVTVEYRTPFGEVRTLKLTNFDARCLQHEVDHLNGKLI